MASHHISPTEMASEMLPYIIVEFSDGSVSTVLDKWFTPERSQVYWPPYASKLQYNRALARNEEVNSTWALYPVKRCLYKTDNLQKAQQKERKAEEISNLDSSGDENIVRKRIRPHRFCYSDDSDNTQSQSGQHERPPKINFKRISKQGPSRGSQPTVDIGIPYIGDQAEFCNKYSSHGSQAKEDDVFPCSSDLSESALNDSVTEISKSMSSSAKNDIGASVLPILIKIREQNSQILELLRQKGFGRENNIVHIEEDSIVRKLPAETIENLHSLDNEVKDDKAKLTELVSYLSSLGGDGVVTRTNRILKSLMTNSLASQLNFKGRNKQAFSIFKLKEIINEVVKSKVKTAETYDIETAIKNWLKHAPQRLKLSEKNKD